MSIQLSKSSGKMFIGNSFGSHYYWLLRDKKCGNLFVGLRFHCTGNGNAMKWRQTIELGSHIGIGVLEIGKIITWRATASQIEAMSFHWRENLFKIGRVAWWILQFKKVILVVKGRHTGRWLTHRYWKKWRTKTTLCGFCPVDALKEGMLGNFAKGAVWHSQSLFGILY